MFCAHDRNWTGFDLDDGASLLMAFRGLQGEAAAQGKAHKAISAELQNLVADPFSEWARGYKVMRFMRQKTIPTSCFAFQERLRETKALILDEWLRAYEFSSSDVAKLKQQYLAKTRKADEAEDEYVKYGSFSLFIVTDTLSSARFAPVSTNTSEVGDGDKYTLSPRIRPVDGRAPPQRSASVSERIAQRLKEIQKKSVSTLANATETPASQSEDTLVTAPKVDKGKGKEVDTEEPLPSPPPLSPPLPPSKVVDTPNAEPAPVPEHAPSPPPSIYLIAGLSMTGIALSRLLSKAAQELKLRPVRVPVLGEYPDCFSGDEFVSWLNANVDGLGGSYERAEDAAKDLTEEHKLLRRVGEFGNLFEATDDAFYQFRPKVCLSIFSSVFLGLQRNFP